MTSLAPCLEVQVETVVNLGQQSSQEQQSIK